MKILLIATWGFPGSWKKAKYIPPIPPEKTHKWTKLTEWQWSNEEIPTYSTTVALTQKLIEQYSDKEDIDIQILIYGIDTLACPPKLSTGSIKEGEEERKGLIEKLNKEIDKFYKKDPENYDEVYERAEKVLRIFVKEYFKEPIKKKSILEKNIFVKILPGVGLYILRDKSYEFTGSPQNTALALELDLFDRLNKTKPDAIILDISHGINYLPVVTVNAVLRTAKIYSALTSKSIPVAILNSDPVTMVLQEAKIHLVQVHKIKEAPLSTLRELITDIEKNIQDLENIQVYKMIKQTKPPERIINLNKEIKQLYKEYFNKAKGILTESEYGLILYTLTFCDLSDLEKTDNTVNTIIGNIHKALCKRKVVVNDKSIRIEYKYALQPNEITSIMYLSKLLKKILESKNEIERYNSLFNIDSLKKYAKEIGLSGMGNIIFENEISDIKRRVSGVMKKLNISLPSSVPYKIIYDLFDLLENYQTIFSKNTIMKIIEHKEINEIITNKEKYKDIISCKINQRNFLAHAGFEKNVTEIAIIDGKIFVGYREDCYNYVKEVINKIINS